MDIYDKVIFKEDGRVIFKDDNEEELLPQNEVWKVLIVDDEPEVHTITKLVLKDFDFEGKNLYFLSAHSAHEAKMVLKDNPDISVMFLDVIMENDNAGLEVVKYTRNVLKNKFVRIILRTGQPGQTPEEFAITEYDINDYKEKTELTSKKLFTCILTALRSYRDLITLESSRQGLTRIIESSRDIFQSRTVENFVHNILKQLHTIFCYDTMEQDDFSGIASTYEGNEFLVSTGTGEYVQCTGNRLYDVIPKNLIAIVEEVIFKKNFLYYDDYFVAYLKSDSNSDNIIITRKKSGLSDWDKDLLSIYFTNIKIAFDNIHLNQEIESTQKEIIITLGEIAEARSKETGNHVKRVAEFVKILAEKYGISPEEIELLRSASPMHDLGKIAIPDSILNKPGRLTIEEFEVMKTHTTIGYEMLKNSQRAIMKLAATVALEHHEKYDGTGYPKGLKGEEISIYARITSVADVFDALGCERVYKKKWEMNDILEFFREARGKAFDPELVDILFDNLDEFIAIKNMFPG